MPVRIAALFLILFAFSANAGEPDPLFQSDEPLDITLRGPFKLIMKERSTEEEEPGTLLLTDGNGGRQEFDIQLRSRGNFRRKRAVCDFTPLRVNFRKSEVKNSIFSKQDKLKLVTHCRTRGKGYKSAVVREYIAYRIFNLMTDASYRVRLLNVRYEDTETGSTETHQAMFIEDSDRLAKRLGREVLEVDRVQVADLDPTHLQLNSLFQLLIGNTDFSPISSQDTSSCCHNHRLFASSEGATISIPYDFDLSGLVNVEHAVPNARFQIRSVTQRLYRGRCVNNALIPDTIARFEEQREAILALVEEQAALDKRAKRQSLRFLEGFFKLIDDPSRVKSRLINDCV